MADSKLPSQRGSHLPAQPVAEGPRLVANKGRLPVMPLAVLLPRIGDLSTLSRLAPTIERRLVELQNDKVKFSGEDLGESSDRVNEESMLSQVLQWLSVGVDNE